jgi:peptide/nickel transport system substrate-binding protein/oligopeptide transport system substrate-binding protein
MAGSMRVGVVAVVVAALVVAGGACTRKGGGDGAANEGEGSAPAGVFRVAVVRPSSLDPSRAKTVDELLVADQLFDSLTAADPQTLEPVPALAASWTTTPDQLHWDFTLRPDARFSDGTAVTAADVKASLERVVRKGSGSSVADLLELVAGYRAVAVDGTATELTGVVAAAPNVVHVDLDSPWSVLPSVLANPAFGVLPAKVAAGEPASFPTGTSVVTSGPYRLTAATSSRLSLAPAAGVSAKTPKAELRLFGDKAAAYDALVAGKVDWSEVPPDRLDDAAERFGRSLFQPYVAELFYAFNLRNPKFADARFREAIVRAVDRTSILTDVYGGTVRAADGLVPEGLTGHQTDPCAGRCGYSPTRSKELVAAMAAEGVAVPEVAIDFESDPTQTAVATAIQKDLAAVGITATLRGKPLAEYQQFAVSGEQELFRLGWIAPYPSADGVLTPLFQTGFPNNLTGFSSAGVDELLRAARADGDAASRAGRWQEAERAILAELPIVPIGQFEIESAAAKRVRGLVVTATGTFDLRTVALAPS